MTATLYAWSELGEGSVTLTAGERGTLLLQVHAVDPRFGVVSLMLPAEQVKPLEEALRGHRIKSAKEAKNE